MVRSVVIWNEGEGTSMRDGRVGLILRQSSTLAIDQLCTALD